MGLTRPSIQIIRHAKAKSLRLRVEPHAIRLTVPTYCSERQIKQFLQQSEDWLSQTWQKQAAQQQTELSWPKAICFFNQSQPYCILHAKQRKNYVFDHQNACIYLAEHMSQDQMPAVLKTIVCDYAKQHLPQYLYDLSKQTGLSFQKCTIRQPKTRWGSCNIQHDIMLHAALVLMPLAIARYICIHELAHTRHFNHSSLFWNEVAQFDAHYLTHKRQLQAYRLPLWWHQ